jgi:hypothetical protein
MLKYKTLEEIESDIRVWHCDADSLIFDRTDQPIHQDGQSYPGAQYLTYILLGEDGKVEIQTTVTSSAGGSGLTVTRLDQEDFQILLNWLFILHPETDPQPPTND